MANVLVFTPQHQLDYQKNYDDFIAFAKNELTLFEEFEFSSPNGLQKGWECDKWSWFDSREKKHVYVSGISQSHSKYILYKQPFSDFARAYFRYHQSLNPKSGRTWFSSLGWLYEALEEKTNSAGRSEVDIMDLDNDVINNVERNIKESELSHGVKRSTGLSLQSVLNFIVKMRFKLNLQEWKNPFPRTADTKIKLDKASRQKEEDKCPSDFQMLQVAEAFRRAETPRQKYFASLCVVLMCQPSRSVELKSLSLHSLQKSQEGLLYLMWHPAKGGDPVSKWVPNLLEDVIHQAIQRLIEISEPARKAAKFAYENPGMFMIHEQCSTPSNFPQNRGLTYTQFANAIGFRSGVDSNGRNITWNNVTNLKWLNSLFNRLNNTESWRREKLSGLTLTANNEVFRKNGKTPIDVDLKFPTYSDLRAVVDNEYKTEDFPNYCGVPLWENITLIRDNEFHKEFSAKSFSWVLPSHGMISDAIGSERFEGIQSIFDELGIFDEDSSALRLTTHQFRHWLNTKLMLAGESDWLIARWSGRADINQNRAYDGRTAEQRSRLTNRIGNVSNGCEVMTIAQVDQILEPYTADTPPPAIVLHDLNLPVSLRSLGIERDGPAIFTGLGYCTHNYAESPCIKNMDCAVCSDHSCLKGLPNTLEELKSIESLDSKELDIAKENAGHDVFGSDRWVTYYGIRLAKIKTLIFRLLNPNLPDGAVVRVPSELDPSPVKRSLGISGVGELEKIIGHSREREQTLIPAPAFDLLALAESDLEDY